MKKQPLLSLEPMIFPEDKNVKVTKIALATEEIYNKLIAEKNAKFGKKETEKTE